MAFLAPVPDALTTEPSPQTARPAQVGQIGAFSTVPTEGQLWPRGA